MDCPSELLLLKGIAVVRWRLFTKFKIITSFKWAENLFFIVFPTSALQKSQQKGRKVAREQSSPGRYQCKQTRIHPVAWERHGESVIVRQIMCEEQDACDRAVSSLLLSFTAVAGVKPSLGGRAGGWPTDSLLSGWTKRNLNPQWWHWVWMGTCLLVGSSTVELLVAADGRTSRPGCFQKVTQ